MKANLKYNNNNHNQLSVTCDLSELYKVRDFVKMHAFANGFNDEEANKIALAVDEACTNLIRHTFNYDCDKNFLIRVEKNKKQFIIIISDEGASFNPLEVSSPDMNEYLRNHRRGGLGIHIMKKVMDEIAYTPSNAKEPRNILKLKKNLH